MTRKVRAVTGVLLGLVAACANRDADKGERLGQASHALTACNAIAQWVAGGAYNAGTRVKNRGILYECRPAPFATWCPGAAYQPGVSPDWRDAWIRIDKCTTPPATVADQVKSSCPGNPAGCCPSGFTPVGLTEGADTFQGVSANQCIVGFGGSDTIAAQGGSSVVIGGDGEDTIQAANGNNFILGGPGIDTIAAGTGNDTIAIFDLCEVQGGETIDGGSGIDTLITPVPLAELQARGVNVSNIDNVVVASNSCRSACVQAPTCSGHGTCVEGDLPGQVRCDCVEPFAGENCEIRRVDVTQKWAAPSGTVGPFGVGGIDTSSRVLTDAARSVLAVSPTGQVTTVFSTNNPTTFTIDPAGARFGVHTATQFEVRASTGNLIAAYARRVNEFGKIVPGTNLVWLPEVPDDFEKPATTHARFYDPSGLRFRFPVPGLLVARLTSTHLVYATQTELVRTTIEGVETWRKPIALETFEISENGSRLIGLLKGGGSRIVHVYLSSGTAGAPVQLGTAFWNMAAAPGGRFTLATTKDSVVLFDQGAVSRQASIPVRWLVSASVSDAGDIAIGGQLASHDALFMVLGAKAGASSVARPVERNDGFRPWARFFPGGQEVLLNETGGLFSFKLRP